MHVQPGEEIMKSLDVIIAAAKLLSEDLVHAESGSDLERKVIIAHLIKFHEECSSNTATGRDKTGKPPLAAIANNTELEGKLEKLAQEWIADAKREQSITGAANGCWNNTIICANELRAVLAGQGKEREVAISAEQCFDFLDSLQFGYDGMFGPGKADGEKMAAFVREKLYGKV
jgi:hypothetical protein